MAIKADPPPSDTPGRATSSAGETESLLGQSEPPAYQAGPSTSSSVYPALPAAAQPNMGSHQQSHVPQPHPTQTSYQSLPPPVWAQRSALEQADHRARRRVLGAYVVGWLIWLTVGMLTSGVVMDFSSGGGGSSGRGGKKVVYPGYGVSPYRKVANARECATFSAGVDSGSHSIHGPIFTATTSIPIKLSVQDMAFFYSAGSWSHGHLDIIRDGTISGAVVEVEARYDDRNLLDASALCSVYEKEGGGHRSGVFVQTPEMNCRGTCHQLQFNVKYRIPDALPSLDALVVNSSIFSVTAKDMLPVRRISVASTNAALEFSGVDAAIADLKTTNAHIAVAGKASESATVISTNGKISAALAGPDTSIKTTNSNIEGEFDVSRQLVLATTNGKVLTHINLIGEAETSAFDVTVRTTNDRAEVVYGNQPARSVLNSKVSSSNGAVLVSHSSNYEGTFTGETTNSPVSVSGPLTTHDPARPSLHRELNMNKVIRFRPGLVDGSIYWKGDEKSLVKGTSIAHTTNSKVDIVFL